MLGFSFSWLTAWGASCFERWCADGVGKEGKGRERKGKEGNIRDMSQSATPATQNYMTTCLETFKEKERFCSFPHRHGDATGKPETRDETRGRSKMSISCETSSNFDIVDCY